MRKGHLLPARFMPASHDVGNDLKAAVLGARLIIKESVAKAFLSK